MTRSAPLISIVVPSYNQGPFIGETLASLVGQGYAHLEIIVIDGSSTDETVEVVQSFGDRVAYFVSEPDRGQADAINKGFAVARGDILAWLNSDDLYMPGTLMKVASRLSECERPQLIYGGCIEFWQEEARAGAQRPPRFDRERFRYHDFISQPSTFWTRRLWELTGPLDESYHYALDWDWFLRAARHCDFEPVDEYLSLYRFHRGHKTSSGGARRVAEVMRVVDTYADPAWSAAFREIGEQIGSYRGRFEVVAKLRLQRFRHLFNFLFSPRLYLRHGPERIDSVLGMI